jgi:hypothetical protein
VDFFAPIGTARQHQFREKAEGLIEPYARTLTAISVFTFGRFKKTPRKGVIAGS